MAQHGMVWLGLVRLGLACFSGAAWQGMGWHCMAWRGIAWLALSCVEFVDVTKKIFKSASLTPHGGLPIEARFLC